MLPTFNKLVSYNTSLFYSTAGIGLVIGLNDVNVKFKVDEVRTTAIQKPLFYRDLLIIILLLKPLFPENIDDDE